MHRRMHRETRRIDRVGRAIEFVSLNINLHQVAGRDLAVMQAKGVDQKVFFTPRHAVGQAQRDVVVNHLGPAEQGKDTVTSGQLQAGLPFIGVHPRLQRGHDRLGGWEHRGFLH